MSHRQKDVPPTHRLTHNRRLSADIRQHKYPAYCRDVGGAYTEHDRLWQIKIASKYKSFSFRCRVRALLLTATAHWREGSQNVLRIARTYQKTRGCSFAMRQVTHLTPRTFRPTPSLQPYRTHTGHGQPGLGQPACR